MTTNRKPSSHATCAHEKTKAARAACRAGKNPPAASRADDPNPRARLREKAARSSEKFGDVREEVADLGKTMSASAKLYMSGHCATSNHDRCIGIYALTPCTCTCHSPNNPQ